MLGAHIVNEQLARDLAWARSILERETEYRPEYTEHLKGYTYRVFGPDGSQWGLSEMYPSRAHATIAAADTVAFIRSLAPYNAAPDDAREFPAVDPAPAAPAPADDACVELSLDSIRAHITSLGLKLETLQETLERPVGAFLSVGAGAPVVQR